MTSINQTLADRAIVVAQRYRDAALELDALGPPVPPPRVFGRRDANYARQLALYDEYQAKVRAIFDKHQLSLSLLA